MTDDLRAPRRFTLSAKGEFHFPARVPRLAVTTGYLAAFLALSALTWVVWQWRFVAAKGAPALMLDQLPREVVRVDSGHQAGTESGLLLRAGTPPPMVEYRWREMPRAKYAHIRIEVSCKGVMVGKMPWDDARIQLLWFDADGKLAPSYLPLWSNRGDQPREAHDMIVPFSRTGTLPTIVIQNLGVSGDMVLHSLQVQPAVPRPGASWAIVFLVSGWLGWVAWGLRRWIAGDNPSRARILMAAALWVGFAWATCVPGPWIPWRPIKRPYPIHAVETDKKSASEPIARPATLPLDQAPAVAPPMATASPETAAAPPAVPAAPPSPPDTGNPARPLPEDGKEPERMGGGSARWVLNNLAAFKRPVHLIVFSLLSAALAMLTGSRRAIWPALMLGALSEFSQWAFGFGFDLVDVLDLMLDAVAVLAGVAIWRMAVDRWMRTVAVKLQSPEANT